MSRTADARSPRSQEQSHNLPARLTNFVGREREIAEIGALIRRERLVTLTGTPGVGKTRLALQVAASVLDTFPDGVWLVELAPLADPDLVPHAVAGVLGVREEPGRALTATLADSLRSRHMSLLLDNCEHLIGAAAALVETLVRACSGLHVLATSREPLAIEGEVLRRVPSLTIPGAIGPQTGPNSAVAALADSEAVRLFVERAKASAASFALNDANVPLVAQICVRLDGIPLAIELAAARVRALSVEQIAARLNNRFRLLTGGSRTALPRQQTLRGAVDWSYDLLAEPEQALLRCLAVFAGGFTLDAAEQMGRLELLTSLVDRSLVQVEEDSDGEARYRLLETLRQYGMEKLTEHGELATARDLHRDYFLALAEDVAPALNERADSTLLTRLEREHDNLRAALGWCLDESGIGDQKPIGPALGLRLAAAIWRLWWLHGHISEGRRWLERALAVPASGTSPSDLSARAMALLGISQLSMYQGDFNAAVTHMTENLAFCRATANNLGVITALHRLGLYLAHRGEHERAVQLCEESVALGRRVGPRVALAMALHTSGIVSYMGGRYDQSVTLSEEAIGLLRELGNAPVLAYTLGSQARAIADLGDPARAIRLAEEGLRISRNVGNKSGIGEVCKDLARFALLAGDVSRAIELVRTSITICEKLGHRWLIANCLYILACVKRAQGAALPAGDVGRDHLLDAARAFGAAASLREQSGVATFAEVQQYECDLELLREVLGETAFEDARAEGRAKSLKQAVDFALETTAPPPLTGATQGSEWQMRQATSAATRFSTQPAADPWSPLTAREREVADLVAAGLTNRQIATHLVISGRTVQGHVASILTRLDFDTRAQIAAWVARRASSASPER